MNYFGGCRGRWERRSGGGRRGVGGRSSGQGVVARGRRSGTGKRAAPELAPQGGVQGRVQRVRLPRGQQQERMEGEGSATVGRRGRLASASRRGPQNGGRWAADCAGRVHKEVHGEDGEWSGGELVTWGDRAGRVHKEIHREAREWRGGNWAGGRTGPGVCTKKYMERPKNGGGAGGGGRTPPGVFTKEYMERPENGGRAGGAGGSRRACAQRTTSGGLGTAGGHFRGRGNPRRRATSQRLLSSSSGLAEVSPGCPGRFSVETAKSCGR
mmetsp:Transcript_8480/g.28847  ORF Transcript_8480/g.28847 Transcript_8480/m.28847 type:complete len:269 (-) Transcript_8480:125-931(-)